MSRVCGARKRGRPRVHDRAWQVMLCWAAESVEYQIADKYRERWGRNPRVKKQEICQHLARTGLFPGMSARSIQTRLSEARWVVSPQDVRRFNKAYGIHEDAEEWNGRLLFRSVQKA